MERNEPFCEPLLTPAGNHDNVPPLTHSSISTRLDGSNVSAEELEISTEDTQPAVRTQEQVEATHDTDLPEDIQPSVRFQKHEETSEPEPEVSNIGYTQNTSQDVTSDRHKTDQRDRSVSELCDQLASSFRHDEGNTTELTPSQLKSGMSIEYINEKGENVHAQITSRAGKSTG